MEEKAPVRNEVFRVRNKSGKVILVSKEQLDPERYELVEEDVKETVVVKKEETVKPVLDPFSDEEETELLTWVRSELRQLPEYKYIERPPRDKNGIVTAILEVRERRKNGEL